MSNTQTTSRRGRKPANKVPYAHDKPLTEWPEDFDRTKHKPLEEDDFAEEVQYLYWERKAKTLQSRLDDANQQADLCRRFPKKAQREKLSSMAKMASKLKALQEELGKDCTPEELQELLSIS